MSMCSGCVCRTPVCCPRRCTTFTTSDTRLLLRRVCLPRVKFFVPCTIVGPVRRLHVIALPTLNVPRRFTELTPALKLRYTGFGVDVMRLLRLPGPLPMYKHFSPRPPWQIRVRTSVYWSRESDVCIKVELACTCHQLAPRNKSVGVKRPSHPVPWHSLLFVLVSHCVCVCVYVCVCVCAFHHP